mgnify:CR=1 FL=1
MSATIACIYKGYLYMAHEFPNGIPANSIALVAPRRLLSEDEIDAGMGHEPLDFRAGFHAGVKFAERMHLTDGQSDSSPKKPR